MIDTLYPNPRRWRDLLATIVLAALVGGGGAHTLRAQDDAPEGPLAAQAAALPGAEQAVESPDTPEVPQDSDVDDMMTTSWSRPVVRVGQDYELRAGERAREIVVVMGAATIAGEVDRDVVVVLGSVRLAPTAVIRGALVAPVSAVVIEEGAVIGREFVVPMGSVTAPPGFHPGGDYVVIGVPGVSRGGQAVVPWFTRGLFWGRPIVPSLPWMWMVVAVIVLVYLAISLLFDRPVRACREVLVERPLSAFLVGLLVLVLIGPASVVLAVSVIGIPVIPFLICGLFIAGLLGKVGVTRWLGSGLVNETDVDSRAQAIRSFGIGTAVILLAYMVPVLGALVWAVGGMFGLGAAMLAFSSGLRRENPGRKRVAAAAAAPAMAASEVVSASPTMSAPVESDVQPLPESERRVFEGPQPSFPHLPVTEAPWGAAPAVAGAAVRPGPRIDGAGLELLAMPKAPFLDRLAAFALDVLLVSIGYHLLDMDSSRAFFTLLLGYHIIFWGLKATTVGGIICNLRIVRTDGAPLSFADALIRGFSSIFSLVALGIGCLWILFDAESQAWHDRFAGTYVVKVPRHWPV